MHILLEISAFSLISSLIVTTCITKTIKVLLLGSWNSFRAANYQQLNNPRLCSVV